MSPKKSVPSLHDKCLKLVTENIGKYVGGKVKKINFIADPRQATDDFLLQCDSGKQFIEENFAGTLR